LIISSRSLLLPNNVSWKIAGYAQDIGVRWLRYIPTYSNSKYGIERGEYVKEKEDAQVPIRER